MRCMCTDIETSTYTNLDASSNASAVFGILAVLDTGTSLLKREREGRKVELVFSVALNKQERIMR